MTDSKTQNLTRRRESAKIFIPLRFRGFAASRGTFSCCGEPPLVRASVSDPKQTNLIRCGVLGYSLIEVLVASAILAIGIAAASVLGMSMVSQQEGSVRVTRGLNCQEQACRLWQLGVPTNAIASILPPDAVISFSAPTSLSITGIGTVEYTICSAVITAGSLFGATSSQTNTMEIVRPSIR